MSRRGRANFLRAGTALGLLVIATAQASAGGFAYPGAERIRAGHIFCGRCRGRGAFIDVLESGDDDSGARNSERNGCVRPHPLCRAHSRSSAARSPVRRLISAARQILAEAAFVPASYLSYQFSPNLWFGHVDQCAVRALVELSLINGRAGISAPVPPTCSTYNATPSIAYRINDWLSVGAGVQIQYATEVFTRGLGPTPGLRSWSSKAMAGVTASPLAPL